MIAPMSLISLENFKSFMRIEYSSALRSILQP